MKVCTNECCCIEQTINRECMREDTCKWAIENGDAPTEHATCDGCDSDCPSAFEAVTIQVLI